MSRKHVPLVLSHSPSSVSPAKALRLLRQFRPEEFGHARLFMRVLPFLLALCFVAFSCKETPPEPIQHIPALDLALEDAQVTEAWLHLKFTDTGAPRGFTLWRDGAEILSGSLPVQDTILVDAGLLPNHSYSYRAFRLAGTVVTDSSSVVQVATMDTTSHTVSWQTFALGDPASSVLYDVAIINDTLVYAVGEMYLRDSSGQLDPILYNLAVWNGNRWNIRRVAYQNAVGTFYSRISWIFELDMDDIWFGNSVHWDGNRYNSVDIGSSVFTGIGSNKMWATSDVRLYVVGNKGTIAYSSNNGTGWQKLTSGTTLDFHDIWGATNPKTGELEVLAVASDPFGTHDKVIVKIAGTNVTPVSEVGISQAISTAWFAPSRLYYVGGSGVTSPIYHKRLLGDPSWVNEAVSAFQYYVFCIRGTDINDVFTSGGNGQVVHFNGMTWTNYDATTSTYGIYFSVAVKGNLVVAVGSGSQGGIIALGKR